MQIQFPPHSKHRGSVTNNQSGHAVYCENDTEHANTLRERNVMLQQVVYIVTTGLKQRVLHAFVNGSSWTPNNKHVNGAVSIRQLLSTQRLPN